MILYRNFKRSKRLSAGKDLYKILGAERNAKPEDIKKAYFSLAKKYHPDINKASDAKEKFAEINNAYETLGDPYKRKTYDSIGLTGDEQDQAKSTQQGPYASQNTQNQNTASGPNTDNTRSGPYTEYTTYQGNFENLNDIFGQFADIFGTRHQKTRFNGEDMIYRLEITFNESVYGTQKYVPIQCKTICKSCNGTKAASGTSATLCTNCGGTGSILIQRGPLKLQTVCQLCLGSGTNIKTPCGTCQGVGLTQDKKVENVHIPAGISNGQMIRVGNGENGDVLIEILVKDNPKFKRIGYDVHSEVPLSISQAALGGILEIDIIYGKVKLNIDPGTNTGDFKRLTDLGFPHLPPENSKKGDFIVTFNVIIPGYLNSQQQSLLNQLMNLDTSEVIDNKGIVYKLKKFYK